MGSKVCSFCGAVKDEAEYYQGPNGKRISRCKPCHIEANRRCKNRSEEARERMRASGRKCSKARRERDPEGVRASERARARVRAKDTKVLARLAVNHAVRAGIMKRPETCSGCNVRCIPHGHHDDYTKPLDVRWLCVLCHGAIHRSERPLATQAPRSARNLKLTTEQVAMTRAEHEAGTARQCDLARRFGVDPSHVNRIVHGTKWRAS